AETAVRSTQTICRGTLSVKVMQQSFATHELRRSHKLEILGRISTDISHDVNHLLAIIMGSIELARERIANEDPANNYLGIAVNATERAARLTRQILDYACERAPAGTEIAINE